MPCRYRKYQAMHQDQNYKLRWQWLARACRLKSTSKWQWSVPCSFLLREGFLFWYSIQGLTCGGDGLRGESGGCHYILAGRSAHRLSSQTPTRGSEPLKKTQHLKKAGHFLSRILILNSNPSPHRAHDEEASIYLIKPRHRVESGRCIDSDAPVFATKRLITE